MSRLSRASASIDSLHYQGRNREIAKYWLSCWRNDAPPTLSTFLETEPIHLRPTTMVCRTTLGRDLHCLWAGPLIRLALGFSISDYDLLKLVPGEERKARLDQVWEIVEGSVSVHYREFTSANGVCRPTQGIALPFADRGKGPTGYFLMHTNWMPNGEDWIMGNVKVNLQSTYGRKTISFTDEPVGG